MTLWYLMLMASSRLMLYRKPQETLMTENQAITDHTTVDNSLTLDQAHAPYTMYDGSALFAASGSLPMGSHSDY